MALEQLLLAGRARRIELPGFQTSWSVFMPAVTDCGCALSAMKARPGRARRDCGNSCSVECASSVVACENRADRATERRLLPAESSHDPPPVATWKIAAAQFAGTQLQLVRRKGFVGLDVGQQKRVLVCIPSKGRFRRCRTALRAVAATRNRAGLRRSPFRSDDADRRRAAPPTRMRCRIRRRRPCAATVRRSFSVMF